jgi:integrase
MDVVFDITYREKVDNAWKTRFEPVGWESEGMTPRKAEKKRERRVVEIAQGTATPATDREQKKAEGTIGAFFDETIMTYQKAKKNKTSERTEARFNTHIRPAFGHLKFHQVTVDMLCKWRDEKLAGGMATATVITLMNILHQAFRIAEERELIKENPFHKIKIGKAKNNNRERALTREEADTLMEAAAKWAYMGKDGKRHPGSGGDPDWPDMILLGLKQGMRLSEVINLQRKDIVFEFNHIMLWVQKSGKKEPFKMAPSVRKMFERRFEKKELNPEDFVFPGPKSGRARKQGEASVVFNKIVATTNLNRGREDDPYQKVVFHTTRHTFGTWLAQAGKDIKTIQKLMRHADIKETLRYMNHAPGYADQVISELDASWDAPGHVEAEKESLPANVIQMPLAR